MLILRYLRMCLVLTALIIISSIPIPTYSQEKCIRCYLRAVHLRAALALRDLVGGAAKGAGATLETGGDTGAAA